MLPAGASELKALAPGEALFRQGDPTIGIFRVERGRIRLERSTYDGRRITLHTALADHFFAEASLFSSAYQCDAVAIEPSLVRCYPKDAVLAMVKGDPVSATSLLATMAHQLHALRHKLELRSVRSARDRILLTLELQAESDGTVRLSREIQDLAFDLGLTREVVYRTLAALEKEGVIERSRSTIRLLKSSGI